MRFPCRGGGFTAFEARPFVVIALIIVSILAGLAFLPIVGSARADQNNQVTRPYENLTGYDNWFYSQRASGSHIPASAYTQGWNHYRAVSAASKSSPLAPSQIGSTWSSVGPSEIDNCVYGVVCSGRVTSIAFDPNHKGTIYVGAAQGGVWKTTNNGSTWAPLTDNQASLAIGALAIDASGNVYAGTGEGSQSCDSYYGAGILRSADGGNTWTLLGNTVFSGSSVTKIAINSSNPSTIWVATVSGVTGSSTESCVNAVLSSHLGIYESTNGGTTWAIKLDTEVKTGFVVGATDLVIDPNNLKILFAGVQASGIWESADGGQTWSGPIASGIGLTDHLYFQRVSLGVTTSPILTFFAVVDDEKTGNAFLYESTNTGSTWTNLTSNLPVSPYSSSHNFCYPQCWYDMYVAPDPTSSSVIFMGGLDLYVSTSGGTSWTDLGGYSGNIHPDQHAFAFAPYSHSVFFSGNDGGVWWSKSGASSCQSTPSSCWTNANSGLGITQFQSIAACPDAYSCINFLFGGTQDNGSPYRTSSTSVWNEIVGGDGGWTAFNPATRTNGLYHTFSGITPQVSTDGGSTWKTITNGITLTDSSQFYVPMSIGGSSTLYLGTYRLYQTLNNGIGWTTTGLTDTVDLSAVTTAAGFPNYVYAGDVAGNVFASNDMASHFTKVASFGSFVTSIATAPGNPQQVVVTVSGFGSSHVFYSADTGSSWTDISFNLPILPANTVVFDGTGSFIYVGMDIGVYMIKVGASAWSTLGSGLPNVAVFSLTLNGNGDLVAATHGRGVWILNTAIVVTFSLSGLGPDADRINGATVLTIDGNPIRFSLFPYGFRWSLNSTHSVVASSPIPGSSGRQYLWNGWTNGGTLGTASGTYQVPATPQTVTATYGAQCRLNLTTSSSLQGTTSPPPGLAWVNVGSTVTVLANPNPGYQLDFWSVNGTNGGSSLPYITTLRGPTNLTARFRIASIELSALVSVYDGRPDLQTAFPQAKLGTYGALVKWANGVVSGQAPDSSYTTLLPYSYWYALMATYQNRLDLQTAFPNAYSSLSSYEGLINWAGRVTSQALVDNSYNGLKPFSYWYVLMMVYNTRSDLQSAFPNAYANQNNFRALVSWAGGVSTSSWPDGSHNVLAPNGYWYDLLSVYNSRTDLQSAFPNAYASWTSYTSLVTWAGGVVTHHWTDGSYGALNTYGYWYDLIMTYNHRPDLQSAFPGAYTSQSEYQSLINWANNVVTGAIAPQDSSFSNLNYYATYYETHHT